MSMTIKLPVLAVSALLLATNAFANCTVSVPFAMNSSALTAQAQAYLQRVASTHSTNAMRLTGHTDAVGSAATNSRLSLARVQAVQNALSAGGVSDDAIVSSNGVGAASQRVQSAGAQAANRRVEIQIANCNPALFQPANVTGPTGSTGGFTGGVMGANATVGLLGIAAIGLLGGMSSTSGTD